MRTQREAATRLPVREFGPLGVIRTMFMDQAHAQRPTSGASAAQLVAQLREARHRTRRLTEELSSSELMGPRLDIVNPMLWEIGHVGWFHEYWTLRHVHGCAPLIERGDRLWDSSNVPHATRWQLDLPDRTGTFGYLADVLARQEDRLGGTIDEAAQASAMGGAIDGMLTELAVLEEDGVVQLPAGMSFEEGATLPCAGLTAWSAVVKLGDIKPGQTVLTQGTGGVSLFALEFAKMCGARVIATSSSDAKIARLKQLGADVTLNYKTTPDWGKKVRELTGRGVDLVVEVGGVGTLNESIRATRIGGTIAFIGVLAGPASSDSRLPLMVMQQQRLQGVTVGSIEDLQALCDGISMHGVKPVIDKVFAFDEVKDAFAHMASGAHFGKIAIAIG